MMAGDLQQAEKLFRQALAVAPNDIDTLTNFGALQQQRGHLHEAIRIYREVLSQDAGEIEVRCNLAKALADSGDITAALHEADSAIDLADGQRGSLATRGAVLIDARRYADAETILQQALTTSPTDDMALVNLALCCTYLGSSQAACNYLVRAVELNPHNARAVADLINCLSAQQEDDGALRLAEGFLAEHPGERMVVGSYAQALLNAGRGAQALSLINPDNLVLTYAAPTPEGYTSLSDFHAALTDELKSDPSLINNPVNKATRGGQQTGELNLDASPVMRAFATLANTAINNAAEHYVNSGLAQHPVMQTAAASWCLRAWGTLINAGGQQEPHMHPLGWLSAVYYAALPDDMDSANNHAGWLEFGKPPDRFNCRRQPPTRLIEPAAGKLVVFPSWLWHNTRPFESTQQRISLAFDVMPLDGRLSSL